MLTTIIDLLCDIVIFIPTTITNTILTLKNSLRHSPTNESLHSYVFHLQTERSALLVQRDNISRQLAALDASIQSILRSTPLELSDPPQSHPVDSQLSNTTPPPRHRISNRTHQVGIGILYPLPFTPARTPETARRNSIIAWVN